MGFVARATLVVLALVALGAVLWLGRDLFFLGFLAALFASFLSLLMRPLQHLGLPRVAAAPIAFLLWLGLLTGLTVLAVPLLEDQVRLLQQELPRGIDRLLEWFEQAAAFVTGQLGGAENGLGDRLEEELSQLGGRLVTGALPVLGSLVGGLAGILVILFGGLYMAIEAPLLLNGFLSLIPVTSRSRVDHALKLAGKNLQRWIMGTVVAMFLVGILTGIGLLVLGIPTPFALALIAGLLEFIPIFGPFIAAAPAVAVALIVSPLTALSVAILYIVVQQVESNLISPLVMKGAVKLPPALTLLFQLLMSILFGFIGLLVAVPLLSALIVVVRTLYVESLESKALGRTPRRREAANERTTDSPPQA